MTTAIIITLCTLLLLAYVFDLTSSRTKVPSVILLLLLGFGMRQLSHLFSITIPDLTPLLPVFGTVGLILIVLEGSLELEFNASYPYEQVQVADQSKRLGSMKHGRSVW